MEVTKLDDDSVYLAPLYKKNSKGKIQVWKISVLPNPDHSTGYDIWTDHGQLDGKMQQGVDSILEGKNIGKKNETSPRQQAIAEAKSKWTKQIERKGYVENIEDVDKDLRPGAEAMLAHRYDKYPEKIVFPCVIQPKLDGHRCIAVVKEGKCELFSRQRTPITGLPHIQRAIEHMCAQVYHSDIILDGELYNHDYKDNFEDLTGYIRSEEPKEGHEVVQYHIYDIVADASYLNRLRALNMLTYGDTLVQVKSEHVNSDAEVLAKFREHRNEGYEGSILRNHEGSYEGKRSYHLQKVKEFMDDEFQIIDVEEGRGKMKGHAIFVCHTHDGQKTFKAKMKGPMEKLVEYYENKDQYIGLVITVMFQEYTKDGIPRFPVALRFKEDV